MIFIVTLLGAECTLLIVMIMINLLQGGAEYKPETLTSWGQRNIQRPS